MPEQKGIFIVLEGADGSGKGTQFKLLTERLKAVGYDVEVFDFPRYEEPSSHFVRKYLNGEYGDAKNISPYTASLFFALDRYEAAPQIKKALADGKIVLSNRYVGSNMAHQGSRFTNSGEQRGFFIWEDGLEFQLLGIPRPTLNIFLRVPAEVSYELIGKKEKRSYTDKQYDQLEGDIEHLKKSVEAYDTLCKLFPKDFKEIECAPSGKLLSIAEINDKIWEGIKPILPAKPPHSGREVVFHLDAQESTKVNTQKTATEEENNDRPKLDDGKLQITVKKVSMLAASHVQAIAGVSCQVSSVQWPADGSYNFYTPADLPKKQAELYKKSFERLAGLHKQIRTRLKDAAKAGVLDMLTPLAALTTIKISADEPAVANLISHLAGIRNSEVKWLAEQIRAAANQQRPGKFAAASLNNILNTTADPLSKIATEKLSQGTLTNTEAVSLQEYWPKNEFALLVDALYPYSLSSRSDISRELENWSYDQKKEAMSAALQSENNPILEEARYRWDVVADSKTLQSIKKYLSLQELQTHPRSPSYGYDTPEEIEAAALDEIYIESFEESRGLYRTLKAGGQESLAEYALLAGYKKRWQFTTTAKVLKDAKTLSDSEDASGIINAMIEKVSEHHYLIVEAIEQDKNVPGMKKEVGPSIDTMQTKKPILPRRRRSRKPKK